MPLQGDQRALLQLLCERGQSYEDIAGLLGGTAADVRERARGALAELGGADPDAEVGLTDYLLGQADPIGRADAVRHLQSDAEAHGLATRIETGLRLIAPEASLPNLPEPRGKRRRAAAPTAAEAAASARGDDSRPDEPRPRGVGHAIAKRQSRLIAAIAAGGVILLIVVLAVAGVFGGSDDGDSTAATTATGTGETDATTTPETSTITRVKLDATDGSGVAGSADFGVVANSQLYVDLDLNGLDPGAPRDSTFFVWLMVGDQAGYPLNQPLVPDQNGRFSGRLPVSAAVATTVAGNADSVRISLSPIRDLAKEARKAAQEQAPIVPFTGTELASGKIPIAAAENG